MFKVEGLTGGWGPTTIVEDFHVTVANGEVVSILGRNGVGKSTTLELIMGRAQYQSGRIEIGDRVLHGLPIYERSRAGLAYVPQNREVFPSLTVEENLTVAARAGLWSVDRLYSLFPPLARRSRSYGSQLSGGEQQMLSVARALISNPSVLLMDEPTEGLAPIVVEQMIEAIRTLAARRSMAILLVEQIVDVAFDLSDRCLIMDRGHVVHQGSVGELRQSNSLIQGLIGFEDGEPTGMVC